MFVQCVNHRCVVTIDRSIKHCELTNHCVLTNHNPLHNQKSDTFKSDMRARMLGARGRVVQKDIGEAHVFLLTCAPWAEPK